MKLLRGFTIRSVIVAAVAMLLVMIFVYNNFGNMLKGGYTTKIVCAGDSLTYGSGVIETRDLDSYPAQLQSLFGADYTVDNFGLRNATASLTGDLPYYDSDEFQAALTDGGDVIILMLGANDSKTYNWDAQAYETGLDTLVKEFLQKNPDAQLVLVRPPYVYSTDGTEVAQYDIQPAVVNNELETIVKNVADENGVFYLDLHQVTDGQDQLYTDGIHFNKEGYGLLAETIYSYLNEEVIK